MKDALIKIDFLTRYEKLSGYFNADRTPTENRLIYIDGEEVMEMIKNLGYSPQFDIKEKFYSIEEEKSENMFLVSISFSYATELYCLKKLNCHLGDLPTSSECEPIYFEKLRKNIEQEFTPISEHLELIDIFPLPMTYIHKTANALLICDEGAGFLTLLSDKTVDPGFIEKIQNCLALPFRQCGQ